MDEMKYLGSTIHSNGECTRQVRKRERGGEVQGSRWQWNLLFGLETVALTKTQKAHVVAASEQKRCVYIYIYYRFKAWICWSKQSAVLVCGQFNDAHLDLEKSPVCLQLCF